MSAPNAPRVRFAPSPTGYFHLGNARTVLYNWLFARQTGGTLILRIEDTDRERSREEWTKGILDAISWCGLDWDEGPVYQSERSALYSTAVDKLWDAGHLYACDCTPDQVRERTKNNPIPGYDGYCATRGLERGPGRALRFKVPDTGTTLVRDIVRGDVEFENATIEDFIIVKSNGDPLFVLANVVDDRDMAVTHIIRGEEHLPTTPKAVLIWEALGDESLPVYAHLSLLVNERRQKLSKRRDRVAVEDYRALGYLPEALMNYLALLGWSPGDDRELFSLEDLLEAFRLEEVTRSPAYFDDKRLLHFDGLYIRALSPDEFVRRSVEYLNETKRMWSGFDESLFAAIAPHIQERVATLGEVADNVDFLFTTQFVTEPEEFARAIAGDEDARRILELTAERLARSNWDAASLRCEIEAVATAVDRKLNRTQAPIRAATMGRRVGPPLFESLELLGRDVVLERLAAAIERLTT